MKKLNLSLAVLCFLTIFSMKAFANAGDAIFPYCSENSTSVLIQELTNINSKNESAELESLIKALRQAATITDPAASVQEFNKIIGKEANENSYQALIRKLDSLGLSHEEINRIINKMNAQTQRD